jgi:hypothetical protein
MQNSNQKVMQTYGNFFNPPKREKQIVDKWSKDVNGKDYLTRLTSIYSKPDLFSVTVLCGLTF